MSGNNSYQKGHSVTLKNHDYRRNKQDDDYDDNKISRRVAGFTPTVQKVKPAGKCDRGYPLYYVNGGDTPQHVLTPADDVPTREHKLLCNP